MTKLSGLPVESTFALSDALIKLKAGGGGDVQVALSDVTAAIFSGQLKVYTPTGTAGTAGTSLGVCSGWYINLGGIKLAWVSLPLTNTSAGTVTTHWTTITLPSGFFTTVSAMFPTIYGVGNTAVQHITGDGIAGVPPSSFGFYLDGSTSNSSATASAFFIGT